ncbi:hypothetical protein [Streptomyces sp. NPDC088925]|uniref:hypothetical protein n=1 Tax=Streptomyces sp. NPDC088925 TaxID=3365914 RepID=UPI0038131450
MTEQGTRELTGMYEAQDHLERLRAALIAAGIKLPSLRLDLPSCSGEAQTPLLDLGRVNLDTARALTALVERAAHSAPADTKSP